MSNQVQPQTPPSSDEIDLGQLFQMIGKGFNRIFQELLKIVPLFKKECPYSFRAY